jgi:hypothetical protein
MKKKQGQKGFRPRTRMEKYAFMTLLVYVLLLLVAVIGLLIETRPQPSREVSIVIQMPSGWRPRI